jgi:GNAT superfamily N-acetyltransferase
MAGRGSVHAAVASTDPDVEPRPLETGDAERLVRMFSRLSAQTVRRRFFTVVPRLEGPLLASLTSVDHDCHEALVVVVDDEIVGLASYQRHPDDPSEADVAVLVEDGWQHVGLGRRLAERLAGLARQRGIERFHADVLVDNRPAVGLIRRMNPSARGRYVGADGALSFDLPLLPAA